MKESGDTMGKFTSEDIRLAQETQTRYGVPASVTLAQYALESGYGTSYIARYKNNYFGMTNGGKGYQTFNSKADSFNAHGKLLAESRYTSKTAGATTIEEYVNAFASTYATDPGYSNKLLSIIKENNLTQYDSGTYGGVSTTVTTVSDSKKSIGEKILSGVVSGVAVIVVAILAVIFFMTAFDLKIPTGKSVVKKGVEKGP